MLQIGEGDVDRTETSRAAVDRGARKREKTRQLVLDAAEMLMARGNGMFRIEDVAAAASVSEASIYSHFGGKDSLLADVVERLLATTEDRLVAVYDEPVSDAARFEMIGLTFLELLVEHPAVARYLITSAQQPPAPGQETEAASRMGRLRLGFEHAIQAVIDSGEMRPVDARLLSYSLLATWMGIALFGLRHDEMRLSTTEIRDALLQVIQITTDGLRPAP